MIFGWIRLAFFMLVGLSIAYAITSLYVRSLRREALEDEWNETRKGERDTFITAGMQAYEKGLKRRLLWLVYILPMAAMTAVFFYVNWI